MLSTILSKLGLHFAVSCVFSHSSRLPLLPKKAKIFVKGLSVFHREKGLRVRPHIEALGTIKPIVTPLFKDMG
jgi:hypothetical protein